MVGRERRVQRTGSDVVTLGFRGWSNLILHRNLHWPVGWNKGGMLFQKAKVTLIYLLIQLRIQSGLTAMRRKWNFWRSEKSQIVLKLCLVILPNVKACSAGNVLQCTLTRMDTFLQIPISFKYFVWFTSSNSIEYNLYIYIYVLIFVLFWEYTYIYIYVLIFVLFL